MISIKSYGHMQQKLFGVLNGSNNGTQSREARFGNCLEKVSWP